MTTLHLIISGTVQGIGFRKWMKRQAKQFSVVGWIKNREDGAVESVVQGEDDAIRQLIDVVYIGPPLAIVDGVSKTRIQDSVIYHDFIVIQ